MADIQGLVDGLTGSDNQKAYECLQQLERESGQAATVYPYFDVFVEMLDSPNSYVRTRGIRLIGANVQWDVDYKMDEAMDQYLTHITDDKPITARQCIQMLPVIAKHKPDLQRDIRNALYHANPARYGESMRSLVLQDIQKSLHEIQGL